MIRNIGRLRAGGGGGVIPVGFGWKPAVSITETSPGVFTTDYDATPFLVEGDSGVTTYYVDGDAGNDSNPGTSASPKKSLVGVSAGRVTKLLIKARGTFYIGVTGPVQLGHDNLCVEAWDGAECNITTLASSAFPLVWTDEGGGVWSAPAPFSSFNGIAPYSGTDMETLVKYPLAASLAACQATAGTYFRDTSSGIKHYVHTLTGVSPDDGHTVFAANGAAQGFSDAYSFNQRIGFYGVTFLGGSTAMRAAGKTTTNTYTKRFDFVNCNFKHASSTGAFFASGDVEVYHYGCTAGPSDFDGFSCSTATGAADGTVVPRSIEIGCTGYSCGITGGGGANQGSTTHFGGKTIRVNCTYYDNTNDQVADVGEGTRSLSLGVTVGPKRTGTTIYAGFQAGTAAEDTRMWLNGCTFSDVSYEVSAANGSTIYYRNMTAPTVGPSSAGTVTAY